MIHAYSESYLNDAKERLATYYDYAIGDCGLAPDWASTLFVTTGYAEQFERGNPAYLAGMSGIEMARAVIYTAYGKHDLPERRLNTERTPAYWAGWALAEYQWTTGHRFKDIYDRIPFSEMMVMYPVYHEMDISHFVQDMEERYLAATAETNLKRIRENRGLSQAELAQQSGVNLRNIKAYEQRDNNIDKAQGQTLYRMSRVLGCDIEDLLENPMRPA